MYIFMSLVHFGNDDNRYIHLNDYPPDNFIFNELWQELEIASQKGIKIILMVGGAGGAFQNLFSNFDTYYEC